MEKELTLTLYISRMKKPNSKGHQYQESVAAIYNMNNLNIIKYINGGGIQDHTWAAGIRTNYTEGNE